MAKTVDQFSTIEEFRQNFNEVALDLGDVSGLRTTNKDNLVDAMNSLQDKAFFFQEFIYTGTLNQIAFTGNDNFQNELKFRDNRIQVFVRDEHLNESTDYSISGNNADGTRTTITLIGDYASGASKAVQANDVVTIYSFTGSFEGVSDQISAASRWSLSDTNSIYNNNSNGVIINKNNTSPVTTLESGYNFHVNGKSFLADDVKVASGKSLESPTFTDGTMTINSGTLTGGVNGTFSATVQAEHLRSTDDLVVDDDASIGGILGVDGDFDVNTNKFTVAAATGNTVVAGTLSVSGLTSLDGSVDLGDATSDTITMTGRVDSDIIPSADNSKDLGSSTLKFAEAHATTFHGALSGNATTATSLQNARTIGGVSFDGSADINLPGVNAAGNQSTSGNAATATALATPRNIGGVAFDGSANINLPGVNTTGNQSTTGNAATATALATPRNIAGVSFDGSANIDIAIGNLSNVTSSTPSSGQILAYDSDNNIWALESQGTTSTIQEVGTRKFYTETRGDTTTQGSLVHSNHGNITVTEIGDPGDAGYEIRFTAAAQYGDDDVDDRIDANAAGAGLASSNGVLSVNTSNGVKIDGDDVELDYEVITSGSFSGTPSGTNKAVGHLFFVI